MTNTLPLDEFCAEMHRCEDRQQSLFVGVALSPLHPVALGLPPSLMGLATVYDRQLTPQQGFIFFPTMDALNRYASKINP